MIAVWVLTCWEDGRAVAFEHPSLRYHGDGADGATSGENRYSSPSKHDNAYSSHRDN